VIPCPPGMGVRQHELENPYLLSHQKIRVQSWPGLPIFGKDTP
jgi:hypothetical protein